MNQATWFTILDDLNCTPDDIERAIMSGADVNWQDDFDYNSTALHQVATWHEDHHPVHVAQLLIRHGARINISNNFGHTPAMLCVEYQRNGNLQTLLTNVV